ncbi:MAG: acetyl-CoA carboxylase biotin carboxyl carrier protein [Lachnospiraceae bacterium]|nr:acetyl-CoA carboxylase biotin carboxyl carrier protein [Lachnospiraceae bacterium]MDD3616483.1 acetyl-CoA carboxylase biotin carboxyl carrier protein [Lachnospiraceae bacterium]
MEFDKLIELISAVSKSNLTQFQLDQEGCKISMKTDKAVKVVAAQTGTAMAAAPVIAAAPSMAVQAETEEETISGNVIHSPLVGTFYNSPSPDAPAFVSVGDTVSKGQTLGIVEAMKLMNEIESEFDGVVEKILVDNESVVEYGQPLFIIK